MTRSTLLSTVPVLTALLLLAGTVSAAPPEDQPGLKSPSRGGAGWFQLGAVLAAADNRAPTPETRPTARPHNGGPPEKRTRSNFFDMVDYSGDLWTRPALTGDWGGLRSELEKKGLKFTFNVTQIVQRNTRGGLQYDTSYTGRAQYGIELDTELMGLWPGGYFKIKAETNWGDSNNGNTGTIIPVDGNALFPVPTEEETALTDWYFIQFFAPQIGVMAGKMSPREHNVFSRSTTEQFMNTAFMFDPIFGTTVPTLSFLFVGVIVRPVDWITLYSTVLDPEGSADIIGFTTAFDRGTSFMQTLEVDIKPFGLPGTQRIHWTWTDQRRIQLQQNPQIIVQNILQGRAPDPKRSGSDCSFFWDFDQYVYTVPGHPDRGLGVFGRFGISDGEVNPIGRFYSIGVGGKGLVPTRENDSFGIGFYYVDLSTKLPRLIRQQTRDERGVELYYNMAVTPWLHITHDVQIINPARTSARTTVIAGVRMRIDF